MHIKAQLSKNKSGTTAGPVSLIHNSIDESGNGDTPQDTHTCDVTSASAGSSSTSCHFYPSSLTGTPDVDPQTLQAERLRSQNILTFRYPHHYDIYVRSLMMNIGNPVVKIQFSVHPEFPAPPGFRHDSAWM